MPGPRAAPDDPRPHCGAATPHGPRLGRRCALGLAAGLLLTAAGGDREHQARKARFEEVGEDVRMTVALPELLAVDDAAAVASLEAAFATTLTYEIAVHGARAGEPIARRRVVVRAQWNAWKERYVVAVEEPGRGASAREFTDRDQAIAAAVTLDRVWVAAAADLERGPEATYFATIVGQRNPVDRGLLSPSQGREASTFSRWIGIFIRSEQRAEKTVALRTSPAFYLVPR